MTPTMEVLPETRASALKSAFEKKGNLFSWVTNSLLIGLLLFISAWILEHPMATNDGPVHVTFAHLIYSLQQPGHPLQQQAYLLHLRPNPNLAVYLLMAALMRLVSPSFAESIVQTLCIAGPVAAGYFAIRTINPKNVWLAIFLLPLALNQMLFLGLYNHSISLAAFFLVIGTYFWMLKSPSYLRAAALSATLILTFFCHASGFIMAFAGLGTMAAARFVLAYFASDSRARRTAYSRSSALREAFMPQRYVLAAMLASLPLAAVFLASGEKGVTLYGPSLLMRLRQFAKLELLSVNFPIHDRFIALSISVLLLTSLAVVGARLLMNKIGKGNRPVKEHRPYRIEDATESIERIESQDQAIAAFAACIVAFLVMLAFPDTMGGGWTHFRRFVIFPYFWILLTLAFESFSPLLIGGFVAIGSTAAVVLTTSMVVRQGMTRQQMAPLAAVDALVGDHCSVLPVVVQSYLVDQSQYPLWSDYQPFFQSTNRLELHGDRVVLFNYLARLAPYPVHFQPHIEPQANIFRWAPQEAENDIKAVDVRNFEQSSPIHVDYMLLWGAMAKANPHVQRQLEEVLPQFRAIYMSSDKRVILYQRLSSLNQSCRAAPLAADLVQHP